MKSPIEQVYEHCLHADVYDLHPDESDDFKQGYIQALEDMMNAAKFKKLLRKTK